MKDKLVHDDSAKVRFRTVLLVLLTFVVTTTPVSGREGEYRSEPTENLYVRVSYYTEQSPSRNPPLHYVLFVEFGVNTVSIGQVEYGLLVDQPELIERTFSGAYFGSPGKDICPDGQKLSAAGDELSEQDQQAGFYGATAGEFSLSPRRSLYARTYSTEPLALINCFIERLDGREPARETCDDLQLQVVKAQGCKRGPFTYEPYQGD